jgi:hypothetical protein
MGGGIIRLRPLEFGLAFRFHGLKDVVINLGEPAPKVVGI